MYTAVRGFSKLSKQEKIDWLIRTHFHGNHEARKKVETYWNSDEKLQKLHDDFIENTVSNFYLPLGVAPNFKINGKYFTLPMAIEESSVVAAAAKSAKYWGDRGGFNVEILGEEKIGQIHFIYSGEASKLATFIDHITPKLLHDVSHITSNMEKRGGGIQQIELKNQTEKIANYYQLHLRFLTADSMGANFINSCLEKIADRLTFYVQASDLFSAQEKKIEIVMSILSNYVPNCVAKAYVSCPVEALETEEGLSKQEFAEKFVRAVNIAQKEPYRAVTHNKGIMNGVDAVVIATGNDFRAVEAGVHAYAARNGTYTSLSNAFIEDGQFHFELKLPLAVGTVGGLTQLHPLVKWSLSLLGNPSASELMQIIAVAGLAQNFAALRSLVTSGIQKGHMKMHLLNILNQLNATEKQKEAALDYFKKVPVSHSAVAVFLNSLSNDLL
ncbi:MAG: hydroxymethylglutaryl-CoA reductase, degradative [Flavobacteriaceae bacterium]